MNYNDFLLLRELYKNNSKPISQRQIADNMSVSLGFVNKHVTKLKSEGFLTESLSVTQKGKDFLNSAKPKNAIILAAGYGLRMIPINQNKPKALLSVDGKPLIERQIEHLLQVGITDITIVVGFMKEAFEYLINKYNVNLVYNKNYSSKNNLYSVACVIDKISPPKICFLSSIQKFGATLGFSFSCVVIPILAFWACVESISFCVLPFA